MADDTTSGERAGMIAFGDIELGIRREIEVVAERFPETDPNEVEMVVREVLAELRDDATVEAHILAVTRNEAIHRLETQGHRFRPATLQDQPGPDEERR